MRNEELGMRNKKITNNREQGTKKEINFLLCSLLFALCYFILACDNIVDTPEIQTSVESGYGRISISFTDGEALSQTERTVLPSIVFDKYVYVFTKSGETTAVEKTPDNQGSFTLEVGSYTVTVQAYLNNILAARGESPQFSVGPGSNDPVKVRLSYVTTGEQGEFKYIITYPAGADVDITLKKWPNMEDIRLEPANIIISSIMNRKTETLNLGTGTYMLTVIVKKDGRHAGKNEAVHIYPSFTTEYTKDFVDDDLLVEIPPTVNATGTILIQGVWADGNIPVSSGGVIIRRWFMFTATASSQYIHASFDTLASMSVQVYSSSGSMVGNQTNLSNTSYNKYISLNVTSGQVYYIKLSAYSYSGGDTYQIAFNTSSTPPSPTITLTEDVWADGNIAVSGGEQWFKFTATASTQYIHTGFGTLTNLYVQVYDTTGSTVGNQTYLTDSSTYTSRPLTSGQVYYIKVTHNSSYRGTYRITFNKFSTPPIPSNSATVTNLTADEWADGNISSTGEQWFSFTATAYTQYIHASFGTLNSSYGLYVQVYSKIGSTVGDQTRLYSGNTYISRSVTNGQVYYIRVTPYSSSYSGTYKIAFNTSSTPPFSGSAPSNVTASAASSSSITISWSSVPSVSGYYVYRSSSSSGTYSNIGSTSNTSYTDTELSDSTTYYYRISAYNSFLEGSQSSYAYATTGIPSTPSNVTASAASSSSITISWSSVSPASGYYVYRSSSSSGTYSNIGSTSSTSYTNTGLSASTTYYYRVSAFNGSMESSQSSYTYATTLSSSSSGSISLTSNSWYSNTLSAGATHSYRFYAYSGSAYTISWEDSDNSSYTADVKAGLKREGNSTYVVSMTDSNPITFYPTTSGYYIIDVQGYSNSSSGSYRVRYQ